MRHLREDGRPHPAGAAAVAVRAVSNGAVGRTDRTVRHSGPLHAEYNQQLSMVQLGVVPVRTAQAAPAAVRTPARRRPTGVCCALPGVQSGSPLTTAIQAAPRAADQTTATSACHNELLCM
ncbi:hypothetical protein GCM10009864_49450 [Streptomyces lunalinharesii]|uniref:Uncharacterized protein n=1 Tax=Streptomyces lunalinharesii TaxID=333384 RepID=A0ABP6ETL2_9ACTN